MPALNHFKVRAFVVRCQDCSYSIYHPPAWHFNRKVPLGSPSPLLNRQASALIYLTGEEQLKDKQANATIDLEHKAADKQAQANQKIIYKLCAKIELFGNSDFAASPDRAINSSGHKLLKEQPPV